MKSQSAMEYLMTYGWSILVIAVAMGLLFQLGVLNPTNFGPRSQPGNCKVVRIAGEANDEGTCGTLPESVAQFNGQNSGIDAGSSALLRPSQVSVSAWLQTSTVVSWGLVVEYVYSSSGWGSYYLSQGSGGTSSHILFGTSPDGVHAFSVTGPVITDGKWHSIIGTYNGLQSYVYVDGIQYGPSSSSSIGYDLTKNLRIASGASFSPLAGYLSNIQIYNTSLDANQVLALYQEGIGGAPVAPQYVVGWWPLNGDMNDYSGNNNVGTPTNVIFTNAWTSGYTTP